MSHSDFGPFFRGDRTQEEHSFLANAAMQDPYDQEVYRSIELPVHSDDKMRSFESNYDEYGYPAGNHFPDGLSKQDPLFSFQWKEKTNFSTVLPAKTTNYGKPPSVSPYVGKLNFLSTVPLNILLLKIQQSCLNLNIDCEYIEKDYSFRCTGYAYTSAIIFFLNIFFDDSVDCCVVEFQRQQGCCISFAKFWKSIHSLLSNDGVLEDRNGPLIKGFCSVAKTPVTLNIPGDIPIVSCVKHFVEMSYSECQEMQYESMQMLSKFSLNDSNHRIIIDCFGVEAIMRCMRIEDENVRRSATAAMANLLSFKFSSEIVSVFLQNGGIDLLFSLMNSKTLQLVRDVARTILAVVKNDSCNMIITKKQRDAICTLTKHDDQLIKQLGIEIFNSSILAK